MHQFVAAFLVTERAAVIALTTPPITTYHGSVALGFVPANVLIATVRLSVVTDGRIRRLCVLHSHKFIISAGSIVALQDMLHNAVIVVKVK